MDILHREYLKQDLIISVSENMNEIPYVQDFEKEQFIYTSRQGSLQAPTSSSCKGLGGPFGSLAKWGYFLFIFNKEN